MPQVVQLLWWWQMIWHHKKKDKIQQVCLLHWLDKEFPRVSMQCHVQIGDNTADIQQAVNHWGRWITTSVNWRFNDTEEQSEDFISKSAVVENRVMHPLQYPRPPPLRSCCWVASYPAVPTDPSGGCKPVWRVPEAGQPPGTDDHSKPLRCSEDIKSILKLTFIFKDFHPKRFKPIKTVYVVLQIATKSKFPFNEVFLSCWDTR